MNKRVYKADQIKPIMECRRSGLSDYQWCEQNEIHAGTFYNWVSKLKKSGCTIPESESRLAAAPAVQETVKVDLVDYSRKNWLFSDTPDGAATNTLYFIIVEMAKAYNLNLYEYLKYLLEHRPSKDMTDEELAALDPWSKPAQELCVNKTK